MKIQVTFTAHIIDDDKKGVDLSQQELDCLAANLEHLLHNDASMLGISETTYDMVRLYAVEAEAKSGEKQTKS